MGSGLELDLASRDVAAVPAEAVHGLLVERPERWVRVAPGVGDEPVRPRGCRALAEPRRGRPITSDAIWQETLSNRMVIAPDHTTS